MTDEEHLDQILSECCERQNRGEPVDVERLLTAHPGLAPELRKAFFALGLADVAFGRLEDATPKAPETIGQYRVVRELGSGGMGTVYLAESGGTSVALKVLHPHLLSRGGFFKRFLQEAHVGRRIDHPNVVRTLDVDAIQGAGRHFHFLVMEYAEGQTLRELQEELDRVPEELCRHIAREICKALGAIHEAGVVHRDLKPENVLITPDHDVKVMDLGVARLADESIRLSQTGAFVGSVEYAAPEQFGGGNGPVDHRSDLHALGLLLYEISTGVHPFRGDEFTDVMRRVCDEQPRRLGDVNPQLSPFFEEVVATLLAKAREDRFQDAGFLLGVFEEGESSDWWHERARALRATTKRPLRRVRIPRETNVYGRERELASLRNLYEQAKSGNARVVLLEGEAGIGKSRVVDELVERLRNDGEDLNFLFGSYPPSGAALASGGFSSAFREHFGDAGCADYLPQTPLLVPAFDAVLKGEPPPSDVVALTTEALGTCFVHALRTLAAGRPTVVLIDDLHFAPQESRDLLMTLALAAPGHRVLLIGTTRPGLPEDWRANLTRLEQASHHELDRLSPKDLALLLRDSFQSERLAEELGYKIALKSDGNPFFVFEIIRGLREGQFITRRDDGTWISTRVIEDIQIPSSVLDLVNARVADLTEEERDLLDVACCWGFEFDPLLVGKVVGLARVSLLKRFGQIERRHRLVRSSGRSYVFDHHQVQESLYASLSELLREEYHCALADALERRTGAREQDVEMLPAESCVELCRHFLMGGRGARAERYLVVAARHLVHGHDLEQAADLIERALAIPGLLSGTARIDALLELCRRRGPLDMLGRRARHLAAAIEAERLATAERDERRRLDAIIARGVVLHLTSRNRAAESVFRSAVELARRLGDRRSEGLCAGNLGNVFARTGRHDEATRQFERAAKLLRESGDIAGARRCLNSIAITLYHRGRLDEAKACLEQFLASMAEIADQVDESIAAVNLGHISWSQGQHVVAEAQAERAIELARATGNRHLESQALGLLGNVLITTARPYDALALYEQQLALATSLGDRLGMSLATGRVGLALFRLGQPSEARTRLETQLELSEEMDDSQSRSLALLNLGCVALNDGDLTAAEQSLRASLTAARSTNYVAMIVDGQLALAEVYLAEGELARARECAESARVLADEARLTAEGASAACLLSLCGGYDVADAVRLVEARESLLALPEVLELRSLLWRATRDHSHLVAARRALAAVLEQVPVEHRSRMCRELRLHREILEAWREEFGEPGDTPEGASPGESPTRAGDPLT